MNKNSCFQKKYSFYLHVLFFYYIILVSSVFEASAQSEVTLSIRAGGSKLIGIGIEGFNTTGTSGLISEVKSTLADDLNYCGLFQVKEIPDSLQSASQSMFEIWKAANASCLIYGIETQNSTAVSVKAIDLKTAVTLFEEEYLIIADRPWYTAHVIADDIIGIYNGVRGSLASQIAFVRSNGEYKDLFLMDPDGRRRRQMTFSRTLNLSPSWSSNGESIAYSSLNNENWAIVMINVNTGQTLDISQWPGLNTSPSWNPTNPDIIAFTSTRDGNAEIYTCRRNGKDLRRLTNHFGIDSSPTWSPDGSKIAFTSDRSGMPKVYIMNSDGSGIRRLTPSLDTYEDSPCWSPRGNLIAFVILSDYGFDIATINLNGDEMIMLTYGSGSNENPKWSPDGLKILFTSNRLGGKNLFVMNWDGSDIRPLTKDGNSLSPAWAPTSSGDDIRVSSRR
ncbi:MAG: PD40 domain-containing protein [Candidatus Latescibacteria bacterium]|nr:PD40 domain-containing protein [Candidatus Latescibacterota bacterium]